jgi:flagellar hook-length control protein FliK
MEHNTASLQWVPPAAHSSMNSRSSAPGASAGGSAGEEGQFANTLAACGAPKSAVAASDSKSAEDSTSEPDESTNDKTARSSPTRGKNKPGTGAALPSEFAWGLPVKLGDFDALTGMPTALDADLAGAQGALTLGTAAGGGMPGAGGAALASAGALRASAPGETDGSLALASAEDPTGTVMQAALTGATTGGTSGTTRGATAVANSGFSESVGSELGFGSLAGTGAAVDGSMEDGAAGSGQALAMARAGLSATLAVSDGPLSGTANAGSLLAAAQGSATPRGSLSAGSERAAALAGGNDASLAGPRASVGSTAATLAANLAANPAADNGGTAGAAAGYDLGTALQGGFHGGQGGGVGAGGNVDVAGGFIGSVVLNDSSGPFASFWNAATSLGASSASSLGTTSSVAVPVGSHRFGDALADEVRVLVDPAMGNGLRAATLKLNPEHLGPVEVRVLVQEQQASIAFTAQHAAARDALEAALPRLRDTLLQQGFVQVNLDVGSQQPNLTQQGFAQGGAAQSEAERGFGAYRTPGNAVESAAPLRATRTGARRLAPGSFDGYA